MSIQQKKRHSRWYERIFFSTTVQSILGVMFSSVLPAIYFGERNLILLKLVLIRL